MSLFVLKAVFFVAAVVAFVLVLWLIEGLIEGQPRRRY